MPLVQLKIRRGTALEWAQDDPILEAGEPGVEVDTGVLKVGNGQDAWTILPAITGGGGAGGAVDLADIVDMAAFARDLNKLTTGLAWREAIGAHQWASITAGKPAFMGVGATTQAARDAIGAVNQESVDQAISNLRDELGGGGGGITADDLLLAPPFRPLTGDFLVPQSSTTFVASGVKRTNLEANTTYRFRVALMHDSHTTADIKVRLVGPAGATYRAVGQSYQVAATGAAAGWGGQELNETGGGTPLPAGGVSSTSTVSTLGGVVAPILIEGDVTIGSTAGQLEVQVAQNTAQALMGAVKASSVFDIAKCAVVV